MSARRLIGAALAATLLLSVATAPASARERPPKLEARAWALIDARR